MGLDDLWRGAAVVEDQTGALCGQFVEARRQTLGKAPGVDEDDRRPVGHDEIEYARMHGRPDRAARLSPRHGTTRWFVRGLAECRHVFDGNDHFDVERFAHTGVDDRDPTGRSP